MSHCGQADSELQQIPASLLQGLDIYKALQVDMARAMALKEYGDKIKFIYQILRDIDQHLNEDQKKLKDDLDVADRKLNKGITGARLVISLIKEQATNLATILDYSSSGSDQERIFAACLVFLEFKDNVDSKLEKVEKVFRKACKLLDDNKSTIESIVSKLEEVQRNIVATMKAEIAKQRGIAYGITSALVVLGLPFKVLPAVAILAIAGPIAIAVTEAKTVPELEANFGRQRDKIRGYIAEFAENLRFNTEVASLESSIDTKRTTLKTITITRAIYAADVQYIPCVLLPTIIECTKALVATCTTFLETHPLE